MGSLPGVSVFPAARWSHAAIHSQMVFGNGRAGDTSIYSMVRH